ncbi:MAG: indolepyruvate oxidoreductase subunit beta family protein [Pseudomonadota bacterium]
MFDRGERPDAPTIIKLAIMAVGGQGGGVLTNWVVELAEAQGWHAQATAVAGVAQRTGATIYYIEMAPDTGRAPVFSLAPAPGDVDVLIAAEWMEAGRAVMRGFVTPDRTTLIASTHRAQAIVEKIVPGDGTAPAEEVDAAVRLAARDLIAFDMQRPAVASGSVISATLFGALAGSGSLPFEASAFEDVIRRSGRGVDASLKAFLCGLDGPSDEPATPVLREKPAVVGTDAQLAAYAKLKDRLSGLPEPAREMAAAGLRKVVDFQDVDYGGEYLDLVDGFAARDGHPEALLTVAAAKHIANAMAYDDVIRVADLKTRRDRFSRIDAEMNRADRAMHLTEFMHPRIEEVCSTLPARLGQWIEDRPRLSAWLDRRINRGRRVRTDTIWGFGMLWLVAGRKPHRRGTLRHRIETEHRDRWLEIVHETLATDYALATETLNCRRLIKGYSDTHVRGNSKFDKVLSALPLLEGREDAADWLRRLREAALQDEHGKALDGALKTVQSFTQEPAPAP